MYQGGRGPLPQGQESDTCVCGSLMALLGCKEERDVIKEFLLSFLSLCHRQSQMGHVTIAQNASNVPGSNSSKTLSHLYSSLHPEKQPSHRDIPSVPSLG